MFTQTEIKAINMIKEKNVNCIIVKNNIIENLARQKGIKFLMEMHQKNCLKNTFVADSVVGKAAAMIMSYSGVKKCYAHLISESAYNWFLSQNIEVSYENIVPYIINRDKTDMCPMEKAVLNISDHLSGYLILKEKLKELSAK